MVSARFQPLKKTRLIISSRMNLFIAEKPSTAEAIALYFGHAIVTKHKGYYEMANGDLVSWCYGHLLGYAPPSSYSNKGYCYEALPIVPAKWMRLPTEGKEAQLSLLHKLIPNASIIVHAGDIGREGQVIVDEVLEEARYAGPVKRLWANAIDEVSMKRALASLKDNGDFLNTFKAGVARARSDWLVGMNYSTAFTLAARAGGAYVSLSVGRVQTPTLALIVARDLEIENFIPKPYSLITAEFAVATGQFQGVLRVPKNVQGVDSEGRIVDVNLANAIVNRVKSGRAVITKCETKRESKGAPDLFFLSTLRIRANAAHGFGAARVLDLAQKLYDEGLLTYPRVDNAYLPLTQLADVPDILKHLALNFPIAAKANATIKSPCFDDSKITEHHAIIPTMKPANKALLSRDEQIIYEMVCMRYLAHFFPNYVSDKTTVEVTVASQSAQDVFLASGRVDVDLGWKVVGVSDKDEKEKVEKLPKFLQGDSAKVLKVDAQSKKTEPPKRFTEGTIIEQMMNVHNVVTDPDIKKRLKEVAGIGTEATRGSIIEILKKREYIKMEKTSMISTPIGRALIKALPKNIQDPGLTALWEGYLEGIKEGRVNMDAFLQQQIKAVSAIVESMRGVTIEMPSLGETDQKCPKCESPLRKKTVKAGKYAGKSFLGCSSYPKCDHTEWPKTPTKSSKTKYSGSKGGKTGGSSGSKSSGAAGART